MGGEGGERGERKERETERDGVDEQAATQRGSSKQHNAASRPSMPPRRPDAPAPLPAAVRAAHGSSASPTAQCEPTFLEKTIPVTEQSIKMFFCFFSKIPCRENKRFTSRSGERGCG